MFNTKIHEFDGVFFENVLRKRHAEDNIKVVDMRTDCMTTKGLNFLSDLFRVIVKYTKNNRKLQMDFVVKIEPRGSINVRRIVQEQKLFFTEIIMLKDVLPRIESLVNRQIGPTLCYSSENPMILVMEDLSKKGFVMKDRQKGLSMEHCILVLEQFGRLHGGSIALHEKDPELMMSFRRGIISSLCPQTFLRMMEVSLINISQEIARWKDERFARYAVKLRRLSETISESTKRAYKYEEGEFCVLNHGDTWVNNLLFREDENGKPFEVVMVDHQMSVYTSPAIDLHYFLNTCPEIAIKHDKDDFFMEVYLRSLTATMKSLQCKREPPTMEDLKTALYKRRAYAIFAGVFLYLRMIANQEDTEDFELVLTKLSGDTRMNVFKNPAALEATRKMLPYMDKKGYLD